LVIIDSFRLAPEEPDVYSIRLSISRQLRRRLLKKSASTNTLPNCT